MRLRRNKITESDWIVMRLLHYILATDPSAVSVQDVQKTLTYLGRKYGYDGYYAEMEMIFQDQREKGEFDNPECAGLRTMNGRFNIVQKDGNEQ